MLSERLVHKVIAGLALIPSEGDSAPDTGGIVGIEIF